MHVYQNEIAKGELVKLKSDLDEANIAHEGTLAALRQKHNNSMAELVISFLPAGSYHCS